jgi:hypothetical protein
MKHNIGEVGERSRRSGVDACVMLGGRSAPPCVCVVGEGLCRDEICGLPLLTPSARHVLGTS